jgi:hypothetical protein
MTLLGVTNWYTILQLIHGRKHLATRAEQNSDRSPWQELRDLHTGCRRWEKDSWTCKTEERTICWSIQDGSTLWEEENWAEFLFSGKKPWVSVPENLRVSKDHDDQKPVKAQACWGSLRTFNSYNAIGIDHRIDWSTSQLLSKSINIKWHILSLFQHGRTWSW